MFLGYSLTDLVREDKALFIHGDGRNGKGSLLAVLDSDAATPEFNKLQHVRLAIAEEIPHGRLLDIQKFKLLTGGDAIPIRKLHEESSIIYPTHKLILSGNTLPEIKDTREIAFIEHLIVIKFEQSFLGEKCDPKLRERLLTKDSLSGMLTILVDACQEWLKKDKLIESNKVKEFKNEYLEENDIIGEFILENYEYNDDSTISCKEFIKQFKISRSNTDMSDKAIIAAVEKINGIQKHRLKQGNVFKGIGWKKDDPTYINI